MWGPSTRFVVLAALAASALTGCELIADIDPALLPIGAGGVGGLDGAGGTSAGAGGSGASPGSCVNATLDGAETDVDCGGVDCETCTNGFMCERAADCTSKRCDASGGGGTIAESKCAACLNNDDCLDAAPAWQCLAGVCTDTGAKLSGEVCSLGADCVTTHCVDGVCCGSACGDGDAGDCVACSMAAGAPSDGSCGPVVSGAVCTDGAALCTGVEACDGAGACLCLEDE